jgi:Flp pilus assembly secretin CpaC
MVSPTRPTATRRARLPEPGTRRRRQRLTGGANGFIDLTLGNILDTFTLDARLQAAENEGLINVLSAPKIATLNNNGASIQSGVQLPIQTIANNTVTVQYVNATLRLDVTPHVTAEGTILMDINVQKREPQLAFAVAGAANAPIATKEAQTRVIVRAAPRSSEASTRCRPIRARTGFRVSPTCRFSATCSRTGGATTTTKSC